MLRRLTIENYYLIDRADITFSDGATIFTGETGSGKTMVLGAIGFVLGDRAAIDAVKRGAGRAAVTLEFDPPAPLRERLLADGFDVDPDENATIAREIAQGGKSSLRLNGRAATAAYVREIAGGIADIVGQHEAQRLLAPAYHVELLDRFAGSDALQARAMVAELFARRRAAQGELAALDRDERRALEQVTFARFAYDEIRAAALQPGEDEQLVTRRRVLDNAEKIALALRTAHDALNEGEGAAADSLGAALSALEQISGIGPQFAQMAAQLRALQSEAGDVAASVAREAEALEFDPEELETINARLDAIETLKRKYGGSLQEIARAQEEFAAAIHAYENKDERRRELDAVLRTATADLSQAAQRLSKLRHAAAKRLNEAVQRELQELALPSARFETGFEQLAEPGPDGAEEIEFLFAANKGEAPRKLGKGASGGELSRVLLALVVALAGTRGSTALIFDEIDAGIGGATAGAVGVRLARLAKDAQVVCVTHLAQIASWANAHYLLTKREDKKGASIAVDAVESENERAGEIARMLSGEAHEAALEHARVLLRQASM